MVSSTIEGNSKNKIVCQRIKSKYTSNPDFCYFYEDKVKNFARHIERNHSEEVEVQKILNLPSKSLKKNRALAYLRKKGNYIINASTFFKPVHKSLLNNSEENYIACPFCLGFYFKKLLWKHQKNAHLIKIPLQFCIQQKNKIFCWLNLGLI